MGDGCVVWCLKSKEKLKQLVKLRMSFEFQIDFKQNL